MWAIVNWVRGTFGVLAYGKIGFVEDMSIIAPFGEEFLAVQ
jgi:hypothetical protein